MEPNEPEAFNEGYDAGFQEGYAQGNKNQLEKHLQDNDVK